MLDTISPALDFMDFMIQYIKYDSALILLELHYILCVSSYKNKHLIREEEKKDLISTNLISVITAKSVCFTTYCRLC